MTGWAETGRGLGGRVAIRSLDSDCGEDVTAGEAVGDLIPEIRSVEAAPIGFALIAAPSFFASFLGSVTMSLRRRDLERRDNNRATINNIASRPITSGSQLSRAISP